MIQVGVHVLTSTCTYRRLHYRKGEGNLMKGERDCRELRKRSQAKKHKQYLEARKGEIKWTDPNLSPGARRIQFCSSDILTESSEIDFGSPASRTVRE